MCPRLDRRLEQVAPAHAQRFAIRRLDACDDRFPTAAHDANARPRDQPAETADPHAGGDAADDEHAERAEPRADERELPPPPAAELVAIAPRRKLRPQRLADSYQGRAVAQLGEADIVRCNAALAIAVVAARPVRSPPIAPPAATGSSARSGGIQPKAAPSRRRTPGVARRETSRTTRCGRDPSDRTDTSRTWACDQAIARHRPMHHLQGQRT